jgi:hypothetical protein
LAPGKAADIIAVHGDPLKDVTELEHVSFVMAAGKVFKQCGSGPCPNPMEAEAPPPNDNGFGEY